jgi:hypothetical protein
MHGQRPATPLQTAAATGGISGAPGADDDGHGRRHREGPLVPPGLGSFIASFTRCFNVVGL